MSKAPVLIQVANHSDDADSDQVRAPKISERRTEEIVIAFVGPMASGCTTSADIFSEILEDEYSYEVFRYKLSDYIAQSAKLIGEPAINSATPDERIIGFQSLGDKIRAALGNGYLAAKVIEGIARKRDRDGFGQTAEGRGVPKKLRHVHIIDSIKHPDELSVLKETYGPILWLVGVFAPLGVRTERLEAVPHINRNKIPEIIQRDYLEDDDSGQKVRDVFYHADLFIRNDQENTVRLKNDIERFLEVLFSVAVHTPTTDEGSMYAAYAEAVKSACLSRQVGAAVVSKAGDIIGLGRNDVPRYGGGLYSENHRDQDHRCYEWRNKNCHNDARKEQLYEQIFNRLRGDGLLKDGISEGSVRKAVRGTDVKSLIEYSRAVHAEMDAITSVARSGKLGLLGGSLYSTTFPCHSCARHIVASGIDKVYFIEPYPKSLATDLHSDSVSEREEDVGKKVVFLQFSGIAPKNILKLFGGGGKRKGDDGKLHEVDKRSAPPVVAVSLDDYTTHEKWVIAELAENEEKASRGAQATLFDS